MYSSCYQVVETWNICKTKSKRKSISNLQQMAVKCLLIFKILLANDYFKGYERYGQILDKFYCLKPSLVKNKTDVTPSTFCVWINGKIHSKSTFSEVLFINSNQGKISLDDGHGRLKLQSVRKRS